MGIKPLLDAGTVSTILNDQVGQPQKMLDGAGNVSWHRVAGIFGSTVSQPVGATAANPQRFPGQQFDANIALHYNYFRTYDPATGRYLEADPIGLEGGPNLYTYVDGNPVNFIDPDGEIPILPFLVRGAFGGSVELGAQALRNYARGCRVFDRRNYDWYDVGMSAGVSSLAPGWVSVGKNALKSKGAVSTLSGQLERARTANRAAKLKTRIQAHKDSIGDQVKTQLAFQASKPAYKNLNGDDGCECNQ